MANKFAETIAEAVDDVVEHGFDSEERMEKWMEKIRKAAGAALPSEEKLAKMLRDALVEKYRQMVSKKGIVKHHKGISAFQLDRLTQKMQDELTKRIMASAQLIKLNRAKAIDQTLQRFAGWMSSVPAGGATDADKPKIKKNTRKALSSLPFEERRVLIDQGHKLVASISAVIAENTGAIAMIWHSNWRQPGYDYREDHKERDEHVFLLRDSWARDKGFVKVGPDGFYDDITKVGEEPFCRCYAEWVYNPGDLPQDMLTKKGKEALAAARARRSDSDDRVQKSVAHYIPASLNKPGQFQCIMCSMFREPSSCTAVVGDIERGGLCDYFESDVVLHGASHGEVV